MNEGDDDQNKTQNLQHIAQGWRRIGVGRGRIKKIDRGVSTMARDLLTRKEKKKNNKGNCPCCK